MVDTTTNELEGVKSLQNFESKIQNGVSLVFFHASRCSTCAAQRPAVESLPENMSFSNVFFGEVEYEENEDINQVYGITGFPTIVIYNNGIEQERYVGSGHSETTLSDKINSLL